MRVHANVCGLQRAGEVQQALRKSVAEAQAAATRVEEASSRVQDILERLPGSNTHAQEVSSDNLGYKQAIVAASSYSECLPLEFWSFARIKEGCFGAGISNLFSIEEPLFAKTDSRGTCPGRSWR